MKPGTKHLPRNLRVLYGTRDQRGGARGANQPAKPIEEPPVHIPLAPDYLTAEQIDVFVTRARLLAGMRVMTDADVDLLAMYAVSFCRWVQANRRVAETGEIVRGPNGGWLFNPWLAVANKAHAECARILAEVGMTPSSRNRVSQP